MRHCPRNHRVVCTYTIHHLLSQPYLQSVQILLKTPGLRIQSVHLGNECCFDLKIHAGKLRSKNMYRNYILPCGFRRLNLKQMLPHWYQPFLQCPWRYRHDYLWLVYKAQQKSPCPPYRPDQQIRYIPHAPYQSRHCVPPQPHDFY